MTAPRGPHALPLVRQPTGNLVRWTGVVVDREGQQHRFEARTQDEVRERQEKCLWRCGARPDAEDLTVSGAASCFIRNRRQIGAWSGATLTRVRQDLAVFCVPPWTSVRSVDAEFCRRFVQRIGLMRFASQRSRWATVAGFLRWCVCRELLDTSPLMRIDRSDKPWLGKRARRMVGRGKPQLRNVAEAQAYLAAAARLPEPARRVAAVLPLLCGLRSGEVRHLRVSDLDFEAGRIWVRSDDEDEPDGWEVKTAGSRRTVDLPASLRQDLVALCHLQRSHEFVFRSRRRRGEPWETSWLQRLVASVCRKAGTKVICPHGLRGTYTSILAAVTGASAPDIARLLGHVDDGPTARRHYIGLAEHRPALHLVRGDEDRPASSTEGVNPRPLLWTMLHNHSSLLTNRRSGRGSELAADAADSSVMASGCARKVT